MEALCLVVKLSLEVTSDFVVFRIGRCFLPSSLSSSVSPFEEFVQHWLDYVAH